MQRRCESSPFVCVAVLQGWRWIINKRGVANIVPSTTGGDVVYGFLYDLSKGDEGRLDTYEGLNYAKTALRVTSGLGGGGTASSWQVVDALTYVDLEGTTEGVPRDEYIPRMENAVKDALDKGVPPEYVRKYMSMFLRET
jgi:gamma-glutamylcyclotransferase